MKCKKSKTMYELIIRIYGNKQVVISFRDMTGHGNIIISDNY